MFRGRQHVSTFVSCHAIIPPSPPPPTKMGQHVCKPKAGKPDHRSACLCASQGALSSGKTDHLSACLCASQGTLSSHPPHPPKPVNQTTFRRVCVQAKVRYHPTHPTPTHPTPFCCSVVKVFCGRKWPHSVVTSGPMHCGGFVGPVSEYGVLWS